MPEAATAQPTAPATPAAESAVAAPPNLNNAFENLDQIIGTPSDPKDASASQSPKSDTGAGSKNATAAETSDASKKPALTDDSSSAKSATPKPSDKPADKPADEPDVNQMAPKQLRQAYRDMKKRLVELEAKAAERASEQPQEPPELKEWQSKAEAANKRAQELEERLRYTNYEESEEYKQKYLDPFVATYNEGRELVASLKANTETGETRQATAEDFDAIMRAPDEESAAALIEQLFGNTTKGAMVATARRDALKANNARTKAIEDFRKNGSEREKQLRETYEKQQKVLSDTYAKAIKDGAAKYPQWAKAADDDAKGKAVLERGSHIADLAFHAQGMTREQIASLPADLQKLFGGDGKPNPIALASLHATARNMVAWFPHVTHKLAATEAALKAANAKLQAFEKSQPGRGEGGGPVAPAEQTWEQKLEAMATPA